MVTWFHRLLTVGCTGDDVALVQRKLKAKVTGTFDRETAARVRGVQVAHHLPVTGMVDCGTAEAIGESVRAGLTPDWFSRDLKVGTHGVDVSRLRTLLGVRGDGDRFDRFVEATVRRFQSAHHLPLTGEVCANDAAALSDDVAWSQA